MNPPKEPIRKEVSGTQGFCAIPEIHPRQTLQVVTVTTTTSPRHLSECDDKTFSDDGDNKDWTDFGTTDLRTSSKVRPSRCENSKTSYRCNSFASSVRKRYPTQYLLEDLDRTSGEIFIHRVLKVKFH